MNTRQLGQTDLHIAPVVFGGNVLGWTIDEQQSFKVLDAFVDKGFNCIDTADMYSRWQAGNVGGESETVLGKWTKQRNNKNNVIIATKVGNDMGEGRSLKKSYIIKHVEDSLQRLQTDCIDLLQTHFDDDVTPVDETLEAYDQLIKQGKVKWIGASNLSAKRLQDSLNASAEKSLPKYQTFQPEYNLYAREGFEKQVQGICLESNISVITYFSLASGFLTGKYRSKADYGKSIRGGSMDKYLNDRGLKILAALDSVANDYTTTQAAVALAWLLAQPTVAAPIASATTIEQLDSFSQAVELNLNKEALDLLDKASA